MKAVRRLKNIVRANTNALLEKMENPEKALKQSITDMHDNLRQAKLQIGNALAAEKRLERMLHTHEAEAGRLRGQAATLLKEGREAEAKELLRHRLNHLERADSLQEQLNRQTEGTTLLKQALEALEAKVLEARRQREFLVARRKLAEAKKAIHESISGVTEKNAFSDMTAFEAYDNVVEHVLSAETEADAVAEVSMLGAGDIVGDATGRWSEISVESKVEDELRQLKRDIEESGAR